MVHLGMVLLEEGDARVDLLVTLAQRLHLLEGRSDDPADVAEALAVRGQVHAEGQVGIPEHRSVGERVDELQAVEAAHDHRPRASGYRAEGVVVLVDADRGLVDDVLQGLRAVVGVDDVAQVLVRQGAEHLLGVEGELPAQLEGRDDVDTRATAELALLQLKQMLARELARCLPLVELVGHVVGVYQVVQLVERALLEDVLHHGVRHAAPLHQQRLHLGLVDGLGCVAVGRLPLLGVGPLCISAQHPLQPQGTLH
mmetsp:Transcript_74589/g.189276  ORF Transcript_74589/g.189276 Transcript_74589/m.189276 type:complete len:255 (+) Transcript_74589:767-1531(+)